MRALRLLLAVAVVALVAGCAPKDRAVRLARVEGEGRNLEASLDQLEDRLIASQARVRFWREMRERHESVAAISCAVQDEHADGMAMHALPPVHSPVHQARVAAAAPGAAKPQLRRTNNR